jgi:hypothetical protein
MLEDLSAESWRFAVGGGRGGILFLSRAGSRYPGLTIAAAGGAGAVLAGRIVAGASALDRSG